MKDTFCVFFPTVVIIAFSWHCSRGSRAGGTAVCLCVSKTVLHLLMCSISECGEYKGRDSKPLNITPEQSVWGWMGKDAFATP